MFRLDRSADGFVGSVAGRPIRSPAQIRPLFGRSRTYRPKPETSVLVAHSSISAPAVSSWPFGQSMTSSCRSPAPSPLSRCCDRVSWVGRPHCGHDAVLVIVRIAPRHIPKQVTPRFRRFRSNFRRHGAIQERVG